MRTIHPNAIKIMTVISNVFIVLGIIFLIMMQMVLAISMFAVSLAISLVIFNVLFRDRTGMKIVINISFAIVLIVIIITYFYLSLAVLGLCGCSGYSPVAVLRLLIAMAFLVEERRGSRVRGLQ